ncbi:MAG: ketoacyl-ACP synthase III [bacterium]|nr:ketoacyl-ACP synthase III [bacterium]
MVNGVKIMGMGAYAPPKILDNAYFESIVDTSDEWIVERTGIRERHVVEGDVASSDLAMEASKIALDVAGVKPEEIDLIIIGTVTPDHVFPATTNILQDKLGCTKAAGFDVSTGCTGLLTAIDAGTQFIRSGRYKYVLCVGVEVLTTITDYEDRNTCVLFGDGAGAFLLGPGDDGDGILSTHMANDGSKLDLLYMPAGGSRMPVSVETATNRLHFINMEGKEVFKNAVRAMVASAEYVLDDAGYTNDDVALLIPHQANMRILDATAKRLKIPRERVMINVEKFGNTSAASIGLALGEAIQNGRVKKGDLILMVAFGAGLAAAATLVKWSY